MRKLLLIMAATIMAAACTQSPKENVQAEESNASKVTFIRENFPEQNVDVNAFSGGIQHIGIPTADVQGTVDFYKTLGFEEVCAEPSWVIATLLS